MLDERAVMDLEPLSADDVVRLAYVVARRLVDAHAARDVAQETWIKYQAQAQREGAGWGEGRARAWVACVAANAGRGLLRKARPAVDVTTVEPVDEAAADPGERAADVEEARRQRDALRGALADLPRERRELIALRDLEGLSWSEIGRILGAKPHTLRATHARLRASLRERLVGKAAPDPEGTHV